MDLRQENYWNEHYKVELKNFNEDKDEGEVWFGKGFSRKIGLRVVEELETLDLSSSIIDIGCGNAFLLCYITETWIGRSSCKQQDGNKIKALGIDYSSYSIELSQRIVEARELKDKIELKQCDFLNRDQLKSVTNDEKFKILIDKGTFDAICLLACESESALIEARRKYMESIYSVANPGTLFILASCNYTEEELKSTFEIDCPGKLKISITDRIKTPSLEFGGKKGSQVTCLVLRFH